MVGETVAHWEEFWTYQERTGCGATGRATAATREKGERFKQVLIEHLFTLLARKDAQGWVIPRREA